MWLVTVGESMHVSVMRHQGNMLLRTCFVLLSVSLPVHVTRFILCFAALKAKLVGSLLYR
jgi:hypothetical protein